jgi:hypothetical protein
MDAGSQSSKFELPADAGAAVSLPLVSRERFAQAIGIPVGVVVGWCNKGLVPTLTVGKYSLINVELLRRRCLERDFV